jgi:hypothetical protein
MQFPLKIKLSEVSQTAFFSSLPLTGLSLIHTENVVRAFAPSLFLSLPFLAFNVGRVDIRSPVFRSLMAPCIALSLAGLVSILANMISPANILVFSPDMVTQTPAVGLELLDRYLRLLYTFVVVIVTAEIALENNTSLRRFCHSFIGGYSIGAVFGFGQFVADLIGLPFWTPFGGASWMFSGQTTDFGFRRINGGAPEPSHWAPFSLMAIAFVFISTRGRFSHSRLAVLGLAIFNLLFTLSGSAISGMAGTILGLALYQVSRLISFKIRTIHVITLLGLPIAIVTFYLLVNNLEIFNAYFGEGLLRKLSGQGESGASRIYRLVLTWLAFAERPLFGVGVGSLVSYNTFLTILASGGLLFFLPYAYLVWTGGLRTFIAYRRAPSTQNFGWLMLFCSMFFVSSLAYGEIFSFFCWLWIVLCFVHKPEAKPDLTGNLNFA